MTEFPEIDEYLAPDLVLPYRGKKYVIPSPPGRVGLRIQAVWSLGLAVIAGAEKPTEQAKTNAVLDEGEEFDLYKDCLGPAHDQMLDDGVPLPAIKHCAITALFDIVHGRKAAENYWNSPQGKATTARATSSRTGGGSTTRKRGSTSGTRSRTKN